MITGDTSKARLLFSNGHIEEYDDQHLAYALWLALPRGVRAAFRGKNDNRPVYGWECVDR
jgi:hypothetical protein